MCGGRSEENGECVEGADCSVIIERRGQGYRELKETRGEYVLKRAVEGGEMAEVKTGNGGGKGKERGRNGWRR